MAKSLRDIAKKVTPDIEQSTAMPPEKAKEKEFIDMHKIDVHGEQPWEDLGVKSRAELGPNVGKKEEMKSVKESIDIDLADLTEEQLEILDEIAGKGALKNIRKKIEKNSREAGKETSAAYEKHGAGSDEHNAAVEKLSKHARSSLRAGYLNRAVNASKKRNYGTASDNLRGAELYNDKHPKSLTKLTRNEEVEQIDEVSKGLVKRYRAKASDDLHHGRPDGGALRPWNHADSTEEGERHRKRNAGIGIADKKLGRHYTSDKTPAKVKATESVEIDLDGLTEEQLEVLSELSKKTLKSYERKATTSRDRHERKGAAEEDKAMETDGTKKPDKQNRHNANASAHFKKMVQRDRGLAMVKKRLGK